MTLNVSKKDAPLLHAVGEAFPSEPPKKLGVAVSGGGDSIALLHIAARLAPVMGWSVHAVTVDHGLRPEAADEARFVARFCRKLQINHSKLKWTHREISGNLQDQARKARYGLISDWAKKRGIGHVVVGHTADDQAETFLMELARQAGLDGLSGMRREWRADGVCWLRPLLDITRSDLRDYLTRHDISWVDDPSNEDTRFTRVKARKIISDLAPLGITQEKLAGAAARLSAAREGVEAAVSELAMRIGKEVAGEVIFDFGAFQAAQPELRRRLLLGALKWVSGNPFSPRADSLERAETKILSSMGVTLHGCRIRVTQRDIRIFREVKAVAEIASKPQDLWDGRWVMRGQNKRGLIVRALGAEGLKLCENWRLEKASREALLVSPSVWRGKKLIAAPLAGFANGWQAELCRPFSAAFTRH